MSDDFPRFTAFDPASVSEAMHRQFGWSEAEIRRAAAALMPAALAGIRHFGSTPSGFDALMALMPGPGRAASVPPQSFVGEPLAFVFGPEDVRRRIARHVAEQTGLELPGVETMMPVAATLALGQVARQFTAGPVRDLLDAFLAGYARGRPKPVPNPMRMMAPYTDAMRSFWDGYMGLFQPPAPQDEAPEKVPEPEAEHDAQAEAASASGEPDDRAHESGEPASAGLVEGWLELGRNIQESQVRHFETLFERVDDGSRKA